MPIRYHVNPTTGKTAICRATKRPCKYGGKSGEENHYDTAGEAQQAYEESQHHKQINTISKNYIMDNPELREEYSIPEHFIFKRAYLWNNTINNSNNTFGEPNKMSDKVEILGGLEKIGAEVDEFLEDNPYNDDIYMDYRDKISGIYTLDEMIKGKRDNDLSAIIELNSDINNHPSYLRSNDAIFINLSSNSGNTDNIYLPPKADKVALNLQRTVNEYNNSINNRSNIIKSTAKYIGNFVALQPFPDGNKRTALYSASLALANNGYKPIMLNANGWSNLSLAMDDVLRDNDMGKLELFMNDYFNSDKYDYYNESIVDNYNQSM